MKKSPSSKKSSNHAPSGLQSGSGGMLLFLGGFLGAGKTTLLRAFAQWLGARGVRVGLVANDQGVGLVDGRRFDILDSKFENQGSPAVVEISGGCFCCKSDGLAVALRQMLEEHGPQVILAEPVGSCTDVMATVVRPMEEIYELGMTVGAFAVLLDAGRFEISDLKFEISKADGVNYIFRKQLEEAEVLVVSKADALSTKKRKAIAAGLGEAFPGKDVHFVSAKTGEGLEALWERLCVVPEDRQSQLAMEVDYDLYAHGEAMLGWYNAEVSVHVVGEAMDGNKLLLELTKSLQSALASAGLGIAHLKLSLESLWTGCVGLAVAQVTSNAGKAELSQPMTGEMLVGRCLVNVRAEGDAQQIKAVVRAVLGGDAWRRKARIIWREEAAFQPGRPVPVQRLG